MRTLARIITAVFLAAAVPAAARDFPAKPVRVIVTFPAGSATDIVGRVIARKLSDYWGQNVLADNRPGAGGSIASAIAARATPDGHTVLINSSAHAVNPAIYARLPYDTRKDFIDVAALAAQPSVLVAHPGSRFKSLGDVLAEARANPGKINFAHAGSGTATHLNLEKFRLEARIDVTQVPYQGSPAAITDVLGGRVDFFFAPVSVGMNYIRDGRLRAIAVSTQRRSSRIPDVPTIAEAGVPGFEFVLWFGMWAPAGVPAAVVNRIATDVRRAVADPEVRDRLAALGNEPLDMGQAAFRKFVRREIDEYARIVKAAGIKPQ